jgi:hypothetical protein
MAKKKMTKKENTRVARHNQNDNVMKTVTPIATGVAVAAGIIAMGSALANKENRTKLGKQAQKGLDILQDVASNMKDEVPERYQAIAHQINPDGRERGKKRGRKAKKNK